MTKEERMKKGQYHYFSSTYQLMKPSIPRIVKLRSLEPGFVGVGGRQLVNLPFSYCLDLDLSLFRSTATLQMMVDPSSDAVLLELVQEMHIARINLEYVAAQDIRSSDGILDARDFAVG